MSDNEDLWSNVQNQGRELTGCVSVGISEVPKLVITILILWSLFVGLPVPGGTLELDLLPPAIRFLR
jgi:hypothetical protein